MSGYKTYTFELDLDADLSEADGGTTTDADALYIHTNQAEGMIVKSGNLEVQNYTAEQKTDKVWIWKCLNATSGDAEVMGVYFEDTNGKTQMAGCIHEQAVNGDTILEINYENTKGSDMPVKFYSTGLAVAGDDLNVELAPYEATDLPHNDDKLNLTWSASSWAFSSLGDTASSEEAGELVWVGSGNTDLGAAATAVNIGTKDEDHRTRYGIIVRDPKAHGSSDEVVLEIPGDQVQANVLIKGSASTTVTSGGSTSCTVAEITPVTKLDTEIAGSEGMYNLILVGGPCANKAVEAVSGLGITCSGWSMSEGEAIIKLAANGNKVAMLVAGTNAMDTRRAAKVVANYKDYSLSGSEVTVKGTTLTDITVS